ncbi:fibronectin type III domain-containing protein [Daejeonella sp.]|jgi:uncharacterized protein (TIGR02145 family)|uniref:fibronectin type III domain-containing protein n=1 Tax=Daejeonella sp. TaxID=2805397 RepID=UPI0037C02C30
MKNLYLILLFLIINGCKKSEDGKVEVIPLAPTELKATVISKDQVDLMWKDNSSNETGFKIERKTDSGNFTEIGSTAADLTTFSDKTVDLNTNYTYRVNSFNQVGKSISYSNEVTIKTLNVPALTTYAIDQISSNGANSGGTVTSDGGSTITSLGIVWDTATNPTIALSTKASSTTSPSLGTFKSVMTGLKESTKYFVRAYATNSAGTSYGNELSFTTSASQPPRLFTKPISQISASGAISGGDLIPVDISIISRGVVWSTSINPTIQLSTKTSDGIVGDPSQFQSSINGLQPNTKYYVRAYATNTAGTGYGNELSFTTLFGTVVSATGRIWMDRNLGASRVATSINDVEAYGDYYQWGRGADGHQKGTSATTNILSTTDVPQNSSFIKPGGEPHDWRSPSNDNLWQGVNGINNPCPSGFRLPTIKEWEEEIATWSSKNRNGAFASKLKLPSAGFRGDNGALLSAGSAGNYWSSTFTIFTNIRSAFALGFGGNSANVDGYIYRSFGSCVRCIKD